MKTEADTVEMRVSVPKPVRKTIADYAAKHKTSAKALIGLLLETIAQDNLFDAVLDIG
jgi:hypothetical protein